MASCQLERERSRYFRCVHSSSDIQVRLDIIRNPLVIGAITFTVLRLERISINTSLGHFASTAELAKHTLHVGRHPGGMSDRDDLIPLKSTHLGRPTRPRTCLYAGEISGPPAACRRQKMLAPDENRFRRCTCWSCVPDFSFLLFLLDGAAV